MTATTTNASNRVNEAFSFISGGGDMGALIRAYEWESTPLGSIAHWPQSLRSAVSIMLGSSFPTAIYWGPELVLLYNDAWSPIPEKRHPAALGQPGAKVWSDIWDIVGTQFADVLATGEGFATFDQMLPMVRGGKPSETYWNYSFTPIRGEDGTVAGIFNQGNETTARVLAEKEQSFRLALEEQLRKLTQPIEVIGEASQLLGCHLGTSRVGYADVTDETWALVERDWTDPEATSVAGRHRLEDFGMALAAELRAGRTFK